MQIRVRQHGRVALERPLDFGEFAVLAEQMPPERLREALLEIGQPSGDGDHVFVEQAWIKDQAGEYSLESEWLQSFAAMISYALQKGWMDSDGRIRAHVETLAAI